MQRLIDTLSTLPSSVLAEIDTRIAFFNSFKDRSEEEWFSELCFCLLTANAKARTALALQETLGYKGFSSLSLPDLVQVIKQHKHRFHTTKALRIIGARVHRPIKRTIVDIQSTQGEAAARDWLVHNVKGLGLKEASHFLRNTGSESLAIIDRHISNILDQYALMKKSDSLTTKIYHETEALCQTIAQKINVTPARLDLMLWYLKTGAVLK